METIERSIDIGVPVQTAYNQWTQFEEFPRFMEGVERVGITSGASVPERLVQETVDYFRERGAEVSDIGFVEENVHFALPSEITDAS